MNPAYPLKIYQVLQKYFNNETDARIVVDEIQHTIEYKIKK